MISHFTRDLNDIRVATLPRFDKGLDVSSNPLAKPQSSAVEAWLAALGAGGCDLEMPRGE
jgi:hypothetical protein